MNSTPDNSTEYLRSEVRLGRVSTATKLAHGVGSMPGNYKEFVFNTFLLLYYSQILGLSASWVSLVLAVTLIIDAVTDPLMGAISDNFKPRLFPNLGRRHLFMYLAILPLGISLYCLFSPPNWANQQELLAWLCFWAIATRLAFTLYVVPWAALSAELTDDYEERTSIVVYRVAMAWVGGIAFQIFVYTFVMPDVGEGYGQLEIDNYPTLAFWLAGLVMIWATITTHFTRNQIPYLRQPSDPAPLDLTLFLTEMRLAFVSKNFRLFFFVSLTFFATAGTGAVFDIYMNTYFWELRSEDLRWLGLSIVFAFIALAMTRPLQSRFGKRDIAIVCLVLLIITLVTKVSFRFTDIWPDNGDIKLLPLLVLFTCIQMFFVTLFSVMVVSMLPDMVDEQHLLVGRRQEGIFASAFSFASKTTAGLGLLVGGLLLEHVIAFPTKALPGEIPADTLIALGVVDGLLVPCFFFLPVYLLSRYSLSREKLTAIQAQLSSQ